MPPEAYAEIMVISHYLEGCRFLPSLNNEIPDNRNSTYKERFSLETLVLIMFENDLVLIPRETAWFGYYPDGAFSPVLPPQQTKSDGSHSEIEGAASALYTLTCDDQM